jgi:tryptophan synthase alpha chain
MINIETLFKKNKIFIPYITAGDPNLDTTENLIYALEKSGADIIELGIPFSDSIADGPVIQNAHIRALKSKTTLKKIILLVEKVRKKTDIPILFMMSINSILQYGESDFVKKIKEIQLNGLVVPDLPFESSNSLSKKLETIPLINFIAPTTSEKRIRKIAKNSTGFIYLISSTGVTGVRQELNNQLESIIKTIKKAKNIPVAIGFGISTPEMAKKMASISDGIIIGSAIVKIIENNDNQCITKINNFSKQIAQSIND